MHQWEPAPRWLLYIVPGDHRIFLLLLHLLLRLASILLLARSRLSGGGGGIIIVASLPTSGSEESVEAEEVGAAHRIPLIPSRLPMPI